jgi:uncharacterized protein (TIGR02301 family)
MSILKTILLAMALAATTQVLAQEAAEKPASNEPPVAVSAPKGPPYEAKLSRLAEVLGSVHYLRTLCGDNSMAWRVSMEELLTAENPAAERKAKLIARFNHGYRAFDGVHKQCSQTAGIALARYMEEGEKLADDIASRYGN